ncbi:bifunctional tRNA pseudouridine(32) synthase/23S rRNA pseudouridine(746) synthase RluA [Vibrio sagamiensis]|uniref:Dual-specificity RNA pseudouridine synthase RluA n=1 Tax=Vibrio sagamiensis NBRC 104589 TaxID=1219064 RepID=A0A511QF88_9VIBR|nr:bifunctional tRNA pseudouridine(32) synthase/23S rRNA pseudouridine(746) synthase RluA [Vibrio sagamiensis]PNQ71216.1 bifunctional tRNA pseudouridine(32) synthase/23S rRNA pseudouridine(746) synthase RluA [Vibrio agarivorans]GEM75963.1 ribosomal large subunit pseudouridine synthase A [Vibrio sagamiensis NBRC 104589]
MAMLEYNPPTEPWIDIVFEDDQLLAVNKPSGLLSVPGRLAEHYDSMWSRLQERYPDIQVVHRLDMSTSGLMILAKNKQAESALKKQFQFRLTHKIYYARVWGHVDQEEGEIDLPLICDWPNRPRQKVCFEDGKPSKTLFQVVNHEQHSDGSKTTVVRLLPITGRSHQLRVHMQALGYPIVGDEFYATEEARSFSERLELHASELSFYDPTDDSLRSIFVACDFYPQAKEMIFDYFEPERKLPDYKTLPRP